MVDPKEIEAAARAIDVLALKASGWSGGQIADAHDDLPTEGSVKLATAALTAAAATRSEPAESVEPAAPPPPAQEPGQ